MKTPTSTLLLGALVLAFAPHLPRSLGQTLALYTFDDGTFRDLSGNGHDGTPLMAPRLVEGGVDGAGWGVEFNGTSALRVDLDINPSVHRRLTMGAWVKPHQVASIRHILSHDNGSYDRDIDIDTRGGGLGWSAFRGNGVLGYLPATLEEWQFVAAVWDDVAGTTMLYVDGAMRTSAGRPGVGNTYLYIGRSTCCDAGLSSIIDDVFILSEALSAARLDEIRAGGVRCAPTCPLFLRQPQTRVACFNESVELDADPAGAGPLELFWQKEVPQGSGVWVNLADGPTGSGSVVSGAGKATLRIERCKASDAALYRLLAVNPCSPAGVASRTVGLFVCPPDVNCDGFMDFFDYLDFVEAFAAGEPRADYNDDDFIDFFDYLDFVHDFETGC